MTQNRAAFRNPAADDIHDTFALRLWCEIPEYGLDVLCTDTAAYRSCDGRGMNRVT